MKLKPGDKLFHKQSGELWEIKDIHQNTKKDRTDYSALFEFKGCIIPRSLLNKFFVLDK